MQAVLVSFTDQNAASSVLVNTDLATISRFFGKHSFMLVLLIQMQDCRTFFNLRFSV